MLLLRKEGCKTASRSRCRAIFGFLSLGSGSSLTLTSPLLLLVRAFSFFISVVRGVISRVVLLAVERQVVKILRQTRPRIIILGLLVVAVHVASGYSIWTCFYHSLPFRW